jgi:hypothetical protein
MSEEKSKQCSNCRVVREINEFIGKKGDIVKRCLKCRDKDAKQKQKPEVREKRNARGKEKAYYKKYRERKREENKEEFLQNNAEVMKEWRNNNKEYLNSWRKKNVNYMLHAIKGQAKHKNIPWEITDEHAQQMMTTQCEYCGYINEEHVNGIDRKNNNDGYNEENCVPCCKFCNFMKKALDPQTFIERCLHISCCHGGVGKLNDNEFLWTSTKSCSYKSYKKRAEQKGLCFELTLEEFNEFIEQVCFYCEKGNDASHKNGIDRKENKIGYVKDNCVTCCGECNQMKANMTDIEFIQCTKRVAACNYNLDDNRYQVIPRCYRVVSKRKIIV